MKFSSDIDTISRFLTLAFKFFALTGGVCFSIYCLGLGYFPTGLTMGDAVLLVLLGVSFGVIYVFFLVSILSFGLFFTPLLISLQFLVGKVDRKFGLFDKDRKMLKLIWPNFFNIVFGLIGALLVWAFYELDPMAAIVLPVIAVFIGIVFAKYYEVSEKINKIISEEAAVVRPYESRTRGLSFNKNHYLYEKYFCILIVILVPLMVGGFFGILLEGSMALANVKKGKSYVMLGAPYSSVVPSELKSIDGPKDENYITFEGVDVLFSGVGYKTVVEFPRGDKRVKFEVPNDKIVVVPK